MGAIVEDDVITEFTEDDLKRNQQYRFLFKQVGVMGATGAVSSLLGADVTLTGSFAVSAGIAHDFLSADGVIRRENLSNLNLMHAACMAFAAGFGLGASPARFQDVVQEMAVSSDSHEIQHEVAEQAQKPYVYEGFVFPYNPYQADSFTDTGNIDKVAAVPAPLSRDI